MYCFPTLPRRVFILWERRENGLTKSFWLLGVHFPHTDPWDSGTWRLRRQTLALQTWLSVSSGCTHHWPQPGYKRLSVHRLTFIHHRRWATPLLQCHSPLRGHPLKPPSSVWSKARVTAGYSLMPVQNPEEPNLCNTTQPHGFQALPQQKAYGQMQSQTTFTCPH